MVQRGDFKLLKTLNDFVAKRLHLPPCQLTTEFWVLCKQPVVSNQNFRDWCGPAARGLCFPLILVAASDAFQRQSVARSPPNWSTLFTLPWPHLHSSFESAQSGASHTRRQLSNFSATFSLRKMAQTARQFIWIFFWREMSSAVLLIVVTLLRLTFGHQGNDRRPFDADLHLSFFQLRSHYLDFFVFFVFVFFVFFLFFLFFFVFCFFVFVFLLFCFFLFLFLFCFCFFLFFVLFLFFLFLFLFFCLFFIVMPM